MSLLCTPAVKLTSDGTFITFSAAACSAHILQDTRDSMANGRWLKPQPLTAKLAPGSSRC